MLSSRQPGSARTLLQAALVLAALCGVILLTPLWEGWGWSGGAKWLAIGGYWLVLVSLYWLANWLWDRRR